MSELKTRREVQRQLTRPEQNNVPSRGEIIKELLKDVCMIMGALVIALFLIVIFFHVATTISNWIHQ